MTAQKSGAPTSALHRTDVLSLIFGLLFLGVAGWWAAAYYFDWMITWHLPDVGWLLAGGLILLGLIGILASLRRERRDAPTGTVDAVTDAGAPMTATETGTAQLPAQSWAVWPEDRTAELDRPAADDPTAEPDPLLAGDPTAELDRPVAGDSTAEPDPPAAGDPGGHRPA